jgi:hypothetical protein
MLSLAIELRKPLSAADTDRITVGRTRQEITSRSGVYRRPHERRAIRVESVEDASRELAFSSSVCLYSTESPIWTRCWKPSGKFGLGLGLNEPHSASRQTPPRPSTTQFD